MSASPKMLPDSIGHHYCGSNFYDPTFQAFGVSSSIASYPYNDATTTYHPQTWPDVSSSCKQPHIPLPEISEFLREESSRTVQSPASPTANDLSKNWEMKSHVNSKSSDFQSQQDIHHVENALKTTEKVQSKSPCNDSVHQAETYQPPPKKKARRNDKPPDLPSVPVNSHDQSFVPSALTFSQLLSIDVEKIQTFNSCDYLSSSTPAFCDYQRNFRQSSSLSRGNNISNANSNNNNSEKNSIPTPYFTSLMFDDSLTLPTLNHTSSYSNVIPEMSLAPSENMAKSFQASDSTANPMMYINNDYNSKSLKTQNERSIKNELCDTIVNEPKICNSSKDKNYSILTRSSPQSAYVKLERIDQQNKKQPFFQKADDNNNLKELSWEDANRHTQQHDFGHLQLQGSDALLEDIDLSEVDNACMEQFERECQKEALLEIEHACKMLHIPADACSWTQHQVDQWIMWTIQQCNLTPFDTAPLRMTGIALCKLGEAEMLSRVPTCGDIIHARLRLWKTAAKMLHSQSKMELRLNSSKLSQSQAVHYSTKGSTKPYEEEQEISEEKEGQTSIKPAHASSIHLWMFLRELLLQPQHYGRYIRWIDKEKGVFKIEDSVEVARLWGVRKNRPAMNYDKLSRSIRQYYKKGIIKKTTVSQRLVYQFVNPTLPMSI